MAQATITVGTSGSKASLDTNFGNTQSNFTELYANKREKTPSTLYVTSDHTVSESELLTNDFISNYGASDEVDILLPAVSYNIVKTIVVEAAQIIEIGPPTGEQLYYQGTALTANYVIDSPATFSGMAVITRLRTGASTWVWNIGVAQGTFSNPGRVSD